MPPSRAEVGSWGRPRCITGTRLRGRPRYLRRAPHVSRAKRVSTISVSACASRLCVAASWRNKAALISSTQLSVAALSGRGAPGRKPVLAGLTASGVLDAVATHHPNSTLTAVYISLKLEDSFGEAYAMQILGVVFGFLSVTRLNVSYQRYWEGITSVKVMHSKWADAAVQALTFDANDTHEDFCGSGPLGSPADDDEEAPRDAIAFRRHLVRLFCQLSALATITLHLEEFKTFEPKDDVEEVPLPRRAHTQGHSRSIDRSTLPTMPPNAARSLTPRPPYPLRHTPLSSACTVLSA